MRASMGFQLQPTEGSRMAGNGRLKLSNRGERATAKTLSTALQSLNQ